MRMSDQPLRVALIGPAGVGKTTHARELQKKYKGDVLSFATPLKKILRDLWGERMDDPEFAREQAQKLGTDYVRTVDPSIWIEKLVEKISLDRNVFVDDCRFFNEYLALRRAGFTFIRLSADEVSLARRRPQMTAEQRNHSSEVEHHLMLADAFISTTPEPDLVTGDDGEPHLVDVLEDRPDDIKLKHQKIVAALVALRAEVTVVTNKA